MDTILFFYDEETKKFPHGLCVLANGDVDCSSLVVNGDMIVEEEAEVAIMSLEVTGNLHIKKNAKVIVQGDVPPVIHGDVIMHDGAKFTY